MFDRLGSFVSRHWLPVLLAWAVLIALVEWTAPNWKDITYDGDFAYLPGWMTSVQGQELLEEAFPGVLSKSQLVLVVARTDGPLQSHDFEVAYYPLLQKFVPADGGGLTEDGRFVEDDGGPITSIWHYDLDVIGDMLRSPLSDHGQAVLIVLRLRNEFMAVKNVHFVESVYRAVDEIRDQKDLPQGLQIGVTGSAAVGTDFLRSAEQSIKRTELTTIVLVIGILLLVYRAPGLVIVPLVTIGVSVRVAKGLVGMLSLLSGRVEWFDFKVFSTTEIFIVVILFGAGTDYCLFLISRYREELQRGRDLAEGLAVALGRVGNALAASALTTIFGLGMMFFAEFGKFSNSGPAIALCLAVALVACLTLAPALLRATGRIVFWPFGTTATNKNAKTAGWPLFSGFWQRLSRGIIARPGLILVIGFLVMAPLVYEGLSVSITYDFLNELKPNRRSVAGTKLLRRHFEPGRTSPVTVLAEQKSGEFDRKKGLSKIELLTIFLRHLEYDPGNGKKAERTKPILDVRSLVVPLGGKPSHFPTEVAMRIHPRTKASFVSQVPTHAGNVTRFNLIFRYDPFSRESVELLGHLETQLGALADGSCAEWSEDEWPTKLSTQQREELSSVWRDTTFTFTGTTAGIRDLETVTKSDRLLIQVLVVIAVLAVLILVLRRPVICVYLILSVLLGYFVSIGITELVFSWYYGDTFHGLDWKVPIFLFVILIAVGEDYNIYLTTRVFEEQKRLGRLEGLRVALVRTGGIITSCGVIMAGTFASMATGTLRAMIELGFALSLGVLLDTFIIRTILVPAFLALLAHRKGREPRMNAEGQR